MQGGRGGRDGPFGFDPFAGFGGFGGFGGHQSLLSSVFGGRDPFDDPFFTRPFADPFQGIFPSAFGPRIPPFAAASSSGFIEDQEHQQNKRRGPVIEELDSDDENAEDGGASKTKDNSKKHCGLDREPYVVVPDDEADVAGGRNRSIQHRNAFNSRMNPQSQSQCFTFQSSSVSYGGANGAYYTKSMTKRSGSDGVSFEEFKEADSTTGEANHRISRGLQNKGHSLSRKLHSDGNVDSMQTLHNLNEDELPTFEQAWQGSSGQYLPGWRQSLEGGNPEAGSSGQIRRGGWALPSTQHAQHPGNTYPHVPTMNDAATQRAGHFGNNPRIPNQRIDHPGNNHPQMPTTNDAAQMPRTGKKSANRGSRGKSKA